MLVLSRRPGESLWLGSEVEVRLLRVEGDRVVLGVVAPRQVVVVRGELRRRVAGEIRAAARSRRDGRLAAAVAALDLREVTYPDPALASATSQRRSSRP